jgi:hypothetical protein
LTIIQLDHLDAVFLDPSDVSLLAVRGVLSDNDAPLVSWTSLRLLGRDKPVVSSVVPDWSIINN